MSLLQNSNAISTAGGYNINRSLRFRSSASAYLSRTLTNSNTSFTISMWVKRGTLSAQQTLFAVDGSNFIAFESGDTLGLYSGSGTRRVQSTAVFRDPSAWYHIVAVRNGAQGGSTSVWTLYVNNQSVATYTGNGGTFTSAVAHYLGQKGTSSVYFDGYLTEINYVDGQALTPSDFGETDTTTGVWKPKDYTGTYGTNGFHLNFSDNSAATAAAIGNDISGNNNDWTPTNISVTAGATYDSMTDVPTLTSTNAANYCTINPLSTDEEYAFSNANLNYSITKATTGTYWSRSTLGMSSGKWYFEFTPTNVGSGSTSIAVGIQSVLVTLERSNTSVDVGTGYVYRADGFKITGTTATSGYGATYAANDVIGVAFDADAGTLTFYKNNSSQGTAFTGITGEYVALISFNVTGTSRTSEGSINFGQRPFTYTPPTGYVALNTFNLPDSTIKKGDLYMDATLYTGTGSSLSVTNAASFRPDFVWVKGRSGATDHAAYDAVRGTTIDIAPNTDLAETTQAQGLTAFNSNGFTVGTLAKMNTSAATYVAWQWQAGSSTVTNTSGSISAQVRANTTTGFSIVTYTGTGANATVGHGLGVAPKMIIVKRRNGTPAWIVYHASLTNTQYLVLDTNAAVVSSATTVWNSTTPASSVFSIGSSTGVNASSGLYLAYCWTEITGFSKFGSYTGNGSTDGPFVYTGFRPKFVIIKNSSATGSWGISDTSRNTFNVADKDLTVDLADSEGTSTNNQSPFLDICSNGFKIRTTSASSNGSGNTIIYMAFAENPFKNSLAR